MAPPRRPPPSRPKVRHEVQATPWWQHWYIGAGAVPVLGIVLLLMFFFQFGKYSCITCQGVSHGFGIYLGLIAAFVYVAGSVIKWGSRPTKRAES